MKSEINTSEEVQNLDRRFGSCLFYFPCMIDGEPALFTKAQLDDAKARAARNPEDIPEDKSFWEGLFG